MTSRQLAPATTADIARELGVAPHWVRRHATELQGWKDEERGGPDGAWLYDWGPAISAGRRLLAHAKGRRMTYWWRHEYVQCPQCGTRDLLAKVKVTDQPYPKRDGDRISVTEQLHLLCPTDDPEPMTCPDGGTCHHRCESVCWRVSNAGPLTGVYPGEDWPDDVKAEHTPDTEETDQ